MGLHFKAYDDFIFPPIIKKEIASAKNIDQKTCYRVFTGFPKVVPARNL
jgi:hypothetical protein